MSSFGDDGSEMPRRGSFDDDAIDALLAGTARGEDAVGMAAFIEGLRTEAAAVPTPSPLLAAAIAAGGISTHQPPVAKWRKLRMKIKGFLAGLGVAGKLALGVGVAAAATTGAGAAGILPGPVQHAVSNAVGAVTPFSLPDPDHQANHDENLAGGVATTTTKVGDVTTTSVPTESHDKKDGPGDGNGVVTPTTDGVTPTTVGEHHGDGEGDTTTTVAHDGSGAGSGDGQTTPTTEHHGNGDNNNPESLSIHCERAADQASISCSWSASTLADHARYVLLRTGDGSARVVFSTEAMLDFTDTQVVAGVTYSYRVDSLRADDSVSSHSGFATVELAAVTTTTPTTVHHDGGGTITTTTGESH